MNPLSRSSSQSSLIKDSQSQGHKGPAVLSEKLVCWPQVRGIASPYPRLSPETIRTSISSSAMDLILPQKMIVGPRQTPDYIRSLTQCLMYPGVSSLLTQTEKQNIHELMERDVTLIKQFQGCGMTLFSKIEDFDNALEALQKTAKNLKSDIVSRLKSTGLEAPVLDMERSHHFSRIVTTPVDHLRQTHTMDHFPKMQLSYFNGLQDDLDALEVSIVPKEILVQHLKKFAALSSIPHQYIENGCFARAFQFVEFLKDHGIQPSRIFSGGSLKATKKIYDAKTQELTTKDISWGMHDAVIVMMQNHKNQTPTPVVLDASLSPDEPISPQEWAALQGPNVKLGCFDGHYFFEGDRFYEQDGALEEDKLKSKHTLYRQTRQQQAQEGEQIYASISESENSLMLLASDRPFKIPQSRRLKANTGQQSTKPLEYSLRKLLLLRSNCALLQEKKVSVEQSIETLVKAIHDLKESGAIQVASAQLSDYETTPKAKAYNTKIDIAQSEVDDARENDDDMPQKEALMYLESAEKYLDQALARKEYSKQRWLEQEKDKISNGPEIRELESKLRSDQDELQRLIIEIDRENQAIQTTRDQLST